MLIMIPTVYLFLSLWYQMAYESWREQVEEEENRGRQAEIGNVFLIDRGKKLNMTFLQNITTLTLSCAI